MSAPGVGARPQGNRLLFCFLLVAGIAWFFEVSLYAKQAETFPGAAAIDTTNSATLPAFASDNPPATAPVDASEDSNAATVSTGDSAPATANSPTDTGDSIPPVGQSAAAGGQSSSAVPVDPQDRTAPGGIGPVVNHQIADQHFFSDFLRDYLHDEQRIWTGPFEPHNYDSHTTMHYGIPFIIISGALIASDKTTAKWLPGERSGLDRWGVVYSDVFSPAANVGYSAIWYLVGRATHNEHTREAGFLSLLAIANAETVTGVLKVATWRARPAGHNLALAGFWHGGPSSSAGGLSMPSGHTAGAFAMATVFTREYQTHHKILVPIIAYTLASSVGFARLTAHEHWYSDVFVGSTVGFLVGRYDYINHHDTDLPGAIPVRHTPRPTKLGALIPSFEAGPQGLGLYWYP